MFARGPVPAAILSILLLGWASAARAQLTVAAASDLQTVLPQISERFQRSTGRTLRIAYGSSGNFIAQIQNGAPFDLFLSADTEYVQRLVSSGHAIGSTEVEYATGRLAIWARSDRHVDVSHGMALFSEAAFKRIAIANPQHAPYGRAAVAALRKSGAYERVKDHLVLGENIAQAAQFVESGNADVGFIALSLTTSPSLRASGQAVEVPADLYPPIRQAAVMLAGSNQPALARQFLTFLTSPEVSALFQASGFGPAR